VTQKNGDCDKRAQVQFALADESRVERRSEPRFEAQETILLTLLEEGGDAMPALAMDVSGSGLRLLLNRPVAVGSAVKLEPADTMMLGEVCYCTPHIGHGYYIGIKLRQVLHGLGALAMLNQRLLGDEPRLAPAPKPVNEWIGARFRR
jgi:hypothetical protein